MPKEQFDFSKPEDQEQFNALPEDARDTLSQDAESEARREDVEQTERIIYEGMKESIEKSGIKKGDFVEFGDDENRKYHLYKFIELKPDCLVLAKAFLDRRDQVFLDEDPEIARRRYEAIEEIYFRQVAFESRSVSGGVQKIKSIRVASKESVETAKEWAHQSISDYSRGITEYNAGKRAAQINTHLPFWKRGLSAQDVLDDDAIDEDKNPEAKRYR